MTRVAVDVLGGDRLDDDPGPAARPSDGGLLGDGVLGDGVLGDGVAGDGVPSAVLDALLGVLEADPDLELTLVGPLLALTAALADRGAAFGERLGIADGPEYIGAADDPGRAVRARRRASVRVATRLVRDGQADAVVSRGPLAAVAGAAGFVLGRVPGATRAPFARVLEPPGGPVVLLDAGASQEATPDLLGQFALLGAAYAAASRPLAKPRVALLSGGVDPAAGDALRQASGPLLAALVPAFVGPVTGAALAVGGSADVVVTDGFTGSVVVAALRAAASVGGASVGGASVGGASVGGVAAETEPGCVVLGVDGVVVHAGSGTPRATAEAVALAARLHRAGLPATTRGVMADLVAFRRARAGLPS